MKKKKLSDLSDREKIYTFSVGVTGRCNASCSYCHYYNNRNKKSVAYDISDEQFVSYMKFIKYWCERLDGITSYRFSGGEPLVLGDRLFNLSKIGFEVTGIKPFILTNGKGLTRDWVNKAIDGNISHVFVSIENPINPAKGAPNPLKIADYINEYNSEKLPIIPGVCVVPNNCFKNLYEICEWFYNKLGRIPLVSEVNYSSYITPTEDEWLALKENFSAIIKDFFPKTRLNLFSSVIPEYSYDGKDPYVFDLNLENSHRMNNSNYMDKLNSFIKHLKNVNYPKLYCEEYECPWIEHCNNIKWYWNGDIGNCSAPKIEDYCRFKRMFSDIYYKNIINQDHKETLFSVKQKIKVIP